MKYFLCHTAINLFFICCHGQQLQPGFGMSVNNTFFHKGSSVYADQYFSGGIAPGIGVNAALRVRLTDSWHVNTGLGWHLKQYRVLVHNFNVPEISGYFYFDARFNCFELPVLLAFKTPKPKPYKFEYRVGVVSSLYFPSQASVGYNLEGTETVTAGIVLLQKGREKTYSPDLYVAVSLLKNKNAVTRHEFTISYQYGLLRTATFEFDGFVTTAFADRQFHAILRPTLSSFMLGYLFYPGRLRGNTTE